MLKGLPASGKSTAAKHLLKELRNAKIVNKDQLRAMLDDGKWSAKKEKFVLDVRNYIIHSALTDGLHAIVDDTNLDPSHHDALKRLAEQAGADFEIIDLTYVTVDECIERDRKRPNYVGEQVIRNMYYKYLKRVSFAPAHNLLLPDAVIVDIDGTVATMNGRKPFEWDKVGTDSPRIPVIRMIQSIPCGTLLFVSGRDEICRDATLSWLSSFFHRIVTPDSLLMRPAGDNRKDAVVKRASQVTA